MLIVGPALVLVAIALGILDAMGYAPGAYTTVNALLAAGVILMAAAVLRASARGRHHWHRSGT